MTLLRQLGRSCVMLSKLSGSVLKLLMEAFLQPISAEFFKDCMDAGHACPGKDLGVRNFVLPLNFH